MSTEIPRSNSISTNPVYDLAISYQKTAALIAAARLDVFRRIGNSTVLASTLAQTCEAPLKSIRALCNLLCVLGLLRKSGDGYAIAQAVLPYLGPGSESGFLDVLGFLTSPEIMSMYLSDPEEYVRNGGAAGLGVTSENDPVWTKFATAMIPVALPASRLAASKIKSLRLSISHVLDVAAGHGRYGIAMAHAYPAARITALDWPSVLHVATEQARQSGVSDRYATLPGDLFEVGFPDRYDVILLPNILHHFNPARCMEALARLKSSLATDGVICIIDLMPDPATLAPPEAVAFDFQMLATTPDGAAHTSDDYCEFGSAVGMRKVASWRLLPTPASLLVLR